MSVTIPTGHVHLTASREVVLAAILDQSRLMTPPAVAMQVVNAASRPDSTPAQIAALLSQDPALCAKLLKAVNSSIYGFSQPVASLERAVQILGLNPLRSLVLGLSLPIMQGTNGVTPALREYWIGSVTGAIIARDLATLAKRPNPDNDMVCGLLRDLGAMLIQRAFPEDWASLAANPTERQLEQPCEAERMCFAVDHAEIGAELLKRWNLPDEIVEPIRFHHHPEMANGLKKQLAERAELLHFVEYLTRLDTVVERPKLLQKVLLIAQTRYGLTPALLVKFLQPIAPKVIVFAGLLKLDVGRCPDYAAILSEGCQELVKLAFETQRHAAEGWNHPTPIPGETREIPGSAGNAFRANGATLPLSRAARLPEFRPEFVEAFPATGARLDDYEVQSILGRGAMGIVFKAHEPSLDRPVAIKMLAPELQPMPSARERFVREARTAAAIRHENVVAIYAVRESTGRSYLAMEHLEGGSLEELLVRQGPVALPEFCRYGRELASGLAAAHAKHIVHRDIKPANIMLDAPNGKIKITDFGLARAAQDTRLTRDGCLVGSPLFMAPEQVDGHVTDHRTDLFALGGVLYALCSARPPFPGETMAVIFRGICETEPISIRRLRPDLPGWVNDLVMGLLTKDPERRTQSANEVVRALAER